LKTIKVQVYVHGAPTVIDYNLTRNQKFRSGHPAMQEFFNPPSSYLTIQTLDTLKHILWKFYQNLRWSSRKVAKKVLIWHRMTHIIQICLCVIIWKWVAVIKTT